VGQTGFIQEINAGSAPKLDEDLTQTVIAQEQQPEKVN